MSWLQRLRVLRKPGPDVLYGRTDLDFEHFTLEQVQSARRLAPPTTGVAPEIRQRQIALITKYVWAVRSR